MYFNVTTFIILHKDFRHKTLPTMRLIAALIHTNRLWALTKVVVVGKYIILVIYHNYDFHVHQ